MTLSDSQLATGLGLGMAFALAGLVFLALRLREVRDRYNAHLDLSDGAVLIVEDGRVMAASALAEELLGPVGGQSARGVLSALLGPGSEASLEAVDRLERSGEPIRLLATDTNGRPFELSGEPRGGQLRRVLREAERLGAELSRARAELAIRETDVAKREIETRTLARLLAGAPLLAWNRAPDGRVVWSSGEIPIRQGKVSAGETAEIVAARATRPTGAVRSGAESAAAAGGAAHQPVRFRLEVAQPENADAVALDVIETTAPDGARHGLAVDASAALAAERTLARFVRTMTETFAHLTVGLAIFDRNQSLVLFNPALVEMWQADPAWLAQRPSLREILDGLRSSRRIPEMADFHGWRRRLIELFDDTEEADYEELWHLADGSEFRVLARPHPHGSLAFVFDDVTERLRLEQRYRHSVDLRRATLDRLDEGLAVFGPDGLLQLVNDAFHEIWGADAETAQPSMHAGEIIPLVRGQTVETDVWDRLMTHVTGSGPRQDWTARLTLGTGRIVGARFASLPDGSTMAAFSDVSDSERIALALRERNEALEAAEEMRSAVLDQISHCLRTPLNSLFGFAQLIADRRFGELSRAQCDYAGKILESARHMLAVVDNVTDLASLGLDTPPDEGAAASLGETLMLTGRLLEKRATEEGVALHVAAPEAGLKPHCDAGRLRQIVFNMTANAISRCRDGGAVELCARRAADGVVEIYTAETRTSGAPFDSAAAASVSPTLPFLRRLVAREGGFYELCAEADFTRLSSVCRFRPAESTGDPGT